MSAMFGQPKPAASLSSGLLARKGQARPAMRPQGFSGFGAVSNSLDDLGWNDMGGNEMQPNQAQHGMSPAEQLPPVLVEREELKIEIECAAAAEPTVTVEPLLVAEKISVTAPKRSSAAVRVRKKSIHPARERAIRAAFTLRLDRDRHLRLRLASAMANRSSQQLVTEALDGFLQSLPEIEEIAIRLSQRGQTELGDGG